MILIIASNLESQSLVKFIYNVYATALSLAIEKGNLEMVQLLLSRKDIDINLTIVWIILFFIQFKINYLIPFKIMVY